MFLTKKVMLRMFRLKRLAFMLKLSDSPLMQNETFHFQTVFLFFKKKPTIQESLSYMLLLLTVMIPAPYMRTSAIVSFISFPALMRCIFRLTMLQEQFLQLKLVGNFFHSDTTNL